MSLYIFRQFSPVGGVGVDVNKQLTQFIVAIMGMGGLIALTLVSLIRHEPQTEMLVGALIATTSMAGAWLFRLNGSPK